MKSSKLTTYIFVSLILGIICGWAFPEFSAKLAPLATIFLNMVKMIIAPLLFATLVVGIAGHGDIKDLGKIGVKTLIYFEVVTTITLFIGLFVANVFQPGAGFDVSAGAHQMSLANEMATASSSQSFTHFIVNLFPTSIFKAMADGN